MLCLACVVIILDRCKSLFWPNKARSEQCVDHDEFQELKTTLANYVTRVELQRIEQQLTNLHTEHKELSKYTHTRVHEMMNSINQVQVRLEVLHRDIHKDIEVVASTILGRIDGLNTKMAAMAVSVENLQKTANQG